jgi:hypothetical protein
MPILHDVTSVLVPDTLQSSFVQLEPEGTGPLLLGASFFRKGQWLSIQVDLEQDGD